MTGRLADWQAGWLAGWLAADIGGNGVGAILTNRRFGSFKQPDTIANQPDCRKGAIMLTVC